MLNLKEIRELIDLISERNLAEFEMEKAGFKIKVVRSHPGPMHVTHSTAQPHGAALASPVITSVAMPAITADAAASTPAQINPPSGDNGFARIISPIVGTFYRAPEPNAPPFVKEGDRVSKGQTLCIIEAMKLMNEIEAETAGEIVKILVENGQPVEYGQELFLLKPSL